MHVEIEVAGEVLPKKFSMPSSPMLPNPNPLPSIVWICGSVNICPHPWTCAPTHPCLVSTHFLARKQIH